MIQVVNLAPGVIPWLARNPSDLLSLPTRMSRRNFNVESEQAPIIKIKLQRWDDLPAKGWCPGDNHIHYIRHDQNDDPNLVLFKQAEDVHVADILQMGNMATVAWSQYGWTPVLAVTDEAYSFVPGREDPRTTRRGHTISIHLKDPIRDPQHYLLCHSVFENAQARRGVTSQARLVGEGAHNTRAGLAHDVLFGLADFVEVLQFGMGGSSISAVL